MLVGDWYLADDAQLVAERKRAKALCARYGQTVRDLNRATLHELFGRATEAYL